MTATMTTPGEAKANQAAEALSALASTVSRFGLGALKTTLAVCEALAGGGALLDVAVLGQFKSGKSSLLNALVGADLLPVGVLPVTAVITRVAAGPAVTARVSFLDGTNITIDPQRVVEFVAEGRNPDNVKQAAVVDMTSPALFDIPGVRLVDTPGLGSVFAHNTAATQQWMPNVVLAVVTVSAERPLSEDDLRLIREVRDYAPSVCVVLSKVDLLTSPEQDEVMAFLERKLRESVGTPVQVVPFSARVDQSHWVARFKADVLHPFAADPAQERRALDHKLRGLALACRGYLEVSLRSAESVDADRDRLRAAVLDESVREDVIRDELLLAERRFTAAARPAFEQRLMAHLVPLRHRLADALSADMPSWTGNLARQVQRYEEWLSGRLVAEMLSVSPDAASVATGLVREAEGRFHRVVDAFRDRLARNVSRHLGVSLSPVAWEPLRPTVASPPVSIGKTFDTQWDLLWWLIPMPVFGWVFRRHVRGRLPWEAEKNLTRLVGEWTDATAEAITDLRKQAERWVRAELVTLQRLMSHRPSEAAELRATLDRLGEAAGP